MRLLVAIFLLSSFSAFAATGKSALPETNLSNEAYPGGGNLKRRSNDMAGKDLLTTEQTSSEKQENSGSAQSAKKELDVKKGYVSPVSAIPADETFDAALDQGKTQTGPYDTTATEMQAEEAPAE